MEEHRRLKGWAKLHSGIEHTNQWPGD